MSARILGNSKKYALSPLFIALSCTFTAQAENTSDEIERIEVISKRSSITAEITEDTEKLIEMPGALGDPLQAVFALPGVVAAGGSMSAPAVRGSSPSDNIFEVDFMPAGYIFHDFGSSIFNRNTISDFQLYAAGYGPSYGNATGAVFDVTLRNPKYQPIQTIVDFTMFNAGVFVEGQAAEDHAFYFSARKSTLPLFFDSGEELEDEDGDPSGVTINDAPDDHDYQGKWLWDINADNTLTLNITGAEDSAAAGFSERAELAQKTPEYQGDARYLRKFNSQSIIWDHYGSDFTLKAGVGFLDHAARLTYGQTPNRINGFFEEDNENQINYKARLAWQVNDDHRFVFDAAYYDKESEYKYDGFLYLCTELDPDCDLKKGQRIIGSHKIDNDSTQFGLSHVWQLNDVIQTELGAQYQQYDYTDESFVTPRVAIHYFVSDRTTLTAKAGQYNRLQDLSYILPEIGNPELDSQTSTHATLGLQQELANEWSWSIEAYYKTMEDLPLAIGQNSGELYSNEVEGRAYGLELLVNKNKTDNWYGWLAISYSHSERTDLRNQITRDYYADTPLIINAVFQYEINELWRGGFNFTARSGQSYTPIVGVKQNPEFENNFLPVYGEPFSDRFKIYHRLDIRFERDVKFFGKDGKMIFELMNAYAQDNVSYIDLDYKKIQSVDDFYIKEHNDDFQIRPSIGVSMTF